MDRQLLISTRCSSNRCKVMRLWAEQLSVWWVGEHHVVSTRSNPTEPDTYSQAHLSYLLKFTTFLPSWFNSPISKVSWNVNLLNFQIPKDTPIIFNAYNTAHNPEVYPEPFSCKPDRYLDKDGKVVPPGHPLRHKYVTKYHDKCHYYDTSSDSILTGPHTVKSGL